VDDAHRVVAEHWAAANARDWAAFVADGVVYRAPQTREQVCGRQAYHRFDAEGFPGDRHVTVRRIVGEGQHGSSWIELADSGSRYPGVCFFDLVSRAASFGSPTSGRPRP
jgi:hypothetical protein